MVATPEVLARVRIDEMLDEAGWAVQDPADEPASVLLERIPAKRTAASAGPKRGRAKSAVQIPL